MAKDSNQNRQEFFCSKTEVKLDNFLSNRKTNNMKQKHSTTDEKE